MPLSAGQKLAAYEIVSSLGAGGMGEVYRARDTRLGREVALKILPPDVTNEPGRLERFDREARAIAALNHPHIVTIYSTEEADGIRFLTMELVDGCTLSDLVASSGLAMPRFLEIAIPLADALAAAHQKQITHRDLKPGNVMVSNDGRVKVLDFGLARVGGADAGEQTLIATQAPITHQGTIVGTMPYMSPEQVEARPLDARSDLFSLGVIFYELLSGDRPFKGSSSPALMSAILRDTPSSLGDKRADVPEAIDRLISRLLEKRPQDRVQTARDVFNELRRTQKDLDSGLRPKPVPAETSIAVLPFSDLSEKKDQDWFCDGIAEEIMSALAGLPGLRVAPRTSAFAFRGKADDLDAIGEKLNVNTVLEGSVRRAGDRVRITTRLSDARLGRQLWSERFDRELKDIFDVQDEIARAVADRLRVTIAGAGERLVQQTTTNIAAYELMLRGRIFLNRRGPAIVNSIPCFEQAIALDPNLADAHAGLGDTYRLFGIYGLMPTQEASRLARASLERALAIDPGQVEALATLANIMHAFEWNFAEARALSDRALQRDPSHVRTLAESAVTLATSMAEKPSDGLRQLILDRIARARALDPLSAWAMAIEAMVLTILGRDQDAADASARAVATDPNNFTAHWSRVFTLAQQDRAAEAAEAAKPGLAMSSRHPMLLTDLATLHARRGDVAGAEAIYQELTERSKTSFISPGALAIAAAASGHMPDARRQLAKAIADRDAFISFYKLGSFRPLRADAECAEIIRRSPLMTNAPS